MIHVARSPLGQYGIRRQERPDGTIAEWSPIFDDVRPSRSTGMERWSYLLGDTAEQETMEPVGGYAQPEHLDRPLPEYPLQQYVTNRCRQ